MGVRGIIFVRNIAGRMAENEVIIGALRMDKYPEINSPVTRHPVWAVRRRFLGNVNCTLSMKCFSADLLFTIDAIKVIKWNRGINRAEMKNKKKKYPCLQPLLPSLIIADVTQRLCFTLGNNNAGLQPSLSTCWCVVRVRSLSRMLRIFLSPLRERSLVIGLHVMEDTLC